LESFYIAISPNYLISLKNFIAPKKASKKKVELRPRTDVNEQTFVDTNEDIPPPAKPISKYHPIKQEPPVKDLPETTTNDQSIYSLSIF
jgi:hypothetical protein